MIEVDLRVVGIDAQVDLRPRIVKLVQPRHQPFLQKGRHHADVQHTLGPILADRLQRLAQFRQATLHAGQQPVACFGKGYLPAVAMEQGLVQPLLEGTDLRAHRGRTDAERLRTLGEAEAARHSFKGAQCIEWNTCHDLRKT